MILWSLDSKRQFLRYLNNKKGGVISRFLHQKWKFQFVNNHDLTIPRHNSIVLILIFFLQKTFLSLIFKLWQKALSIAKLSKKREIGKREFSRLIRESPPDANHDSVTSRWLRYAIRPIKPCSSGLVAAICHWPRERHAKYAFKGSSATGRWSFIPIPPLQITPRVMHSVFESSGVAPLSSWSGRLL